MTTERTVSQSARNKQQTQRVTLEREELEALNRLLHAKRSTGLSAYEATAQSAIIAALDRARGR